MAQRNSTIDRDRFISLYLDGTPIREIAKTLKLSYSMARNRALEWGLAKDGNHDKIDVEQLMELYGEGSSLKSIAATLQIPYWSIRHRLYAMDGECDELLGADAFDITSQIKSEYEAGVPIRTIADSRALPLWLVRNQLRRSGVIFKPRRHEVNDTFFATQTPETCYWGGMLAADGWVENRRRIGLELQVVDSEHVQKFANAVEFSGSVYFRSDRPMCSVGFTSDKMAADLRKHFGIIPRKTKVLMPPRHLSGSMARHFIRGYNDGDGGFCATHPKVSMRGCKSVLSWIKSIIQKECDGAGNPSIIWDNGTYKIQFQGLQQFIHITDWLYQGSCEGTRLTRKHKLAQEWKERSMERKTGKVVWFNDRKGSSRGR